MSVHAEPEVIALRLQLCADLGHWELERSLSATTKGSNGDEQIATFNYECWQNCRNNSDVECDGIIGDGICSSRETSLISPDDCPAAAGE